MLILLADDERLVRLGLESMLEELFPEKHSYLHARNGNEVVNLLKSRQPDVAFLDVKMPLMNGLKALEICRDLSPKTLWVILSGYADFDYARQALSLSAFDYILKPIDIGTLRELFERIYEKKADFRKQDNARFSHDVIRSFNMADQLSPEDVEFLPDTPSSYVICLFYIDARNQAIRHSAKQKLCEHLSGFCSSNQGITNHCLFFNTDGNLCLICETADSSHLNHFISLQQDGLPPGAFSVFFGGGSLIGEVYGVSRRISSLCAIRLLKDCSRPVSIEVIEALPNLDELLRLAESVNTLLEHCLSGNRASFKEALNGLSQSPFAKKGFTQEALCAMKNYLGNFFETGFTFHSFEDMLSELETAGCNMTAEGSPSFAGTDMAAVQDYICRHFAQDVSISNVSEIFNLSPSYLSRLFHEKTGQKYIDFVTYIRMEEAMRLLKENPAASVKQVSEAVGYMSVRHFSKTFQRYTGLMPSGYRG